MMNGAMIVVPVVGAVVGASFLWMVKTLYSLNAEIKLFRYAIFGDSSEPLANGLKTIPLIQCIAAILLRLEALEEKTEVLELDPAKKGG